MTDSGAYARLATLWRRACAGLERALHDDFGPSGAAVAAIVLAGFAALLLMPGVFVVGIMLNDVLTASESAYRVAHGHLPGRDFTSAIGVLAYLPQAIAYRATGDLMHAMAIGFVVFAALATLLAGYIAWTRLALLPGILLVATATLLVMAPWVIGTPVTARGTALTTAAMFYNRIGFALVLLAAMLSIPPRPGRTLLASRLDAAWAVAGFTLAFYVKMPFGLAVAALVVYWALLLRPDRRLLAHAGFGTLGTVALMELSFPGLSRGYLGEMQLAVQASSGILYPDKLIGLWAKTLPEAVLVAGLPLALLAARGGVGVRELGFFVCLWGGSLLLLSQSDQGLMLVTPLAAGAFALAALSRLGVREATWVAATLVGCGALMLLAPSAAAIARHAMQARQLAAVEGLPETYRSLRVAGGGVDPARLDRAMTSQLSAPAAFALARGDAPLTTANALPEREYAAILARLPAARELCGEARTRTAVLDYVNVSSSLFGHPPAGGWANLHWRRSFSPAGHVPPERLLKGVGCLFEPKLPQSPAAAEGIRVVYGAFIDAQFPVAGETPYWRVRVRRPGT